MYHRMTKNHIIQLLESLEKIKNSIYNQYDNINRMTHYNSTGPEIWRQTDKNYILQLVLVPNNNRCGMYLKEKNPRLKYGELIPTVLFIKNSETRIFDHKVYPYLTEGIGEDAQKCKF